MNIRDSYIHGADSRGVVKSLYFATSAESVSKADFSANYTTAAGKDLIFLLADTLGTKIGLPIPTLNLNTTGYAGKVLTVKKENNANYYLTFVDSNNTTADEESVYTDAGIYYNPSTDTLTVGAISGPSIVIGGTTLYLNNTQNTLNLDTVISNTSTNNTIPSSKAVWDAILAGMKANDAMIFMGFLDGGADLAHTIYTAGADAGYTYKVRTAGYINGEYYQVNDTFICTVDGTVAATSSNVSTVKANWGVVEGNGDFLDVHGGTMYGTLQWANTTALPRETSPQHILCMDAFADGGTTKWAAVSDLKAVIDTWRGIYTGGTSRVETGIDTKAMNFASSNINVTYLAAGTSSGQSGNVNYFTINFEAKNWSGATSSAAGTTGYMPGASTANRLKYLRGDGTWVALSLTDHTHSIKINDSTKTIAAPGGEAVDLGSYLPLTGGTVTGAVVIKKDLGGNLSEWILKQHGGPFEVGRNSNTMRVTIGVTDDDYGFIQCKGLGITSSGELVLLPGGGNLYFGRELHLIAHAGNISNKSATIGLSLTTIATIAGVDIEAKIPDVTAQAIELVSVLKTLVVSTWTNMAAINTYSGTYAIQISDGTLYASGIFSVCGGTDVIIDEIPLHVSSTGATWRPYARISAGQLQMTTSETTGTARTYTIKILKLI